MSFFGIDCARNKERGELQSDGRFVQLLWIKLSVLHSTNLVHACRFMKFNVTVLLFKSESERKLRANDREYNCSFKYAVSISVLVSSLLSFLCSQHFNEKRKLLVENAFKKKAPTHLQILHQKKKKILDWVKSILRTSLRDKLPKRM